MRKVLLALFKTSNNTWKSSWSVVLSLFASASMFSCSIAYSTADVSMLTLMTPAGAALSLISGTCITDSDILQVTTIYSRFPGI